MLPVLLTSVLSNDPPFSCACKRLAVTLSGDALNYQSRAAGVYTLMQDVTHLNRPVYHMSFSAHWGVCGDDDDCTLYIYALGNGLVGKVSVHWWMIGTNYTSTYGGLESSWSSNYTCPEDASSWEFVTSNGEWSSSGGVDVACCSAGCEDNFAETLG